MSTGVYLAQVTEPSPATPPDPAQSIVDLPGAVGDAAGNIAVNSLPALAGLVFALLVVLVVVRVIARMT